jgi:hypothetical protein
LPVLKRHGRSFARGRPTTGDAPVLRRSRRIDGHGDVDWVGTS